MPVAFPLSAMSVPIPLYISACILPLLTLASATRDPDRVFAVSDIVGLYELERGPQSESGATCQVNLRIKALPLRARITGGELWGENFECRAGLGNIILAPSSSGVGNAMTRFFHASSTFNTLVGTIDSTVECETRVGSNFKYKKSTYWNFLIGDGTTTVDFASVLAGRLKAPLRTESKLLLEANTIRLFVDEHCVYKLIPEAAPPPSSSTSTPTTSGSNANATSNTSITTLGDSDALNNNSNTKPASPEAACFPANARVHLRNGGAIRMAQLRAGDHEIAVPNAYSLVFLFSHRDLDAYCANFLHITTASGHSITITRDHYLYANGRLAAAKAVRIGDTLELISGKVSAVVAIETEHADRGLIAPHALDSTDLYVNGIRTSSYTRAVHPTLAHILLAPIRGAVRLGLAKEPLGALLYKGAGSRLATNLVPAGPDRM